MSGSRQRRAQGRSRRVPELAPNLTDFRSFHPRRTPVSRRVRMDSRPGLHCAAMMQILAKLQASALCGTILSELLALGSRNPRPRLGCWEHLTPLSVATGANSTLEGAWKCSPLQSPQTRRENISPCCAAMMQVSAQTRPTSVCAAARPHSTASARADHQAVEALRSQSLWGLSRRG